MSSRNQGEFSALTRAQSPVEPNSVALAIAIKPSRAAIFGFDRNRVLEIAEDDVHLAREFAGLRPHFLDVRRHEMDHPLKFRRQLEIGARRADREGLEDFARRFHGRTCDCDWARGLVRIDRRRN